MYMHTAAPPMCARAVCVPPPPARAETVHLDVQGATYAQTRTNVSWQSHTVQDTFGSGAVFCLRCPYYLVRTAHTHPQTHTRSDMYLASSAPRLLRPGTYARMRCLARKRC